MINTHFKDAYSWSDIFGERKWKLDLTDTKIDGVVQGDQLLVEKAEGAYEDASSGTGKYITIRNILLGGNDVQDQGEGKRRRQGNCQRRADPRGDSRECLKNPKSVTVNKTKVKLKKKETFKLSASFKADGPVDIHRKICYSSSNPDIATVDKNGLIKAKRKGKCSVYAYAQNGVYKEVKVTVG